MKEFRGHILPSDLYYLLLSYNDKTEWEWWIRNGLVEYNDFGMVISKAALSSSQLDDLLRSAIAWNLSKVVHAEDVTLDDIAKIGS